jgi:hypothetical protein
MMKEVLAIFIFKRGGANRRRTAPAELMAYFPPKIEP